MGVKKKPDISVVVHGVLFEGEGGSWDDHATGDYGVKRKQGGCHTCVNRHIVHQTSVDRRRGYVTCFGSAIITEIKQKSQS